MRGQTYLDKIPTKQGILKILTTMEFKSDKRSEQDYSNNFLYMYNNSNTRTSMTE